MSELFRKAIDLAYRGKLPNELVDRMILDDYDKDLTEAEIEVALLKMEEKKLDNLAEQNREKDLHNENLQKDKI